MQDLSAAEDIFIVESLIRQHLRRLRSHRYVRGSVSMDTFLPLVEGTPDRPARAVEIEPRSCEYYYGKYTKCMLLAVNTSSSSH